ncbi:MAG: hypothetical protein EHM20_13360 [Alphaproteobacteria bacterium]|nr:MAG: hypothetical protein EHM20_13360 [Alphaproteobacteria bacterium]
MISNINQKTLVLNSFFISTILYFVYIKNILMVFPLKESTNVKTKFAQFMILKTRKKRVEIAKKFIETKFDKSRAVLDFRSQRFPETKFDVLDEREKLISLKCLFSGPAP